MKKLTYKNTRRTCYIGYISQAIVVNLMPVLFVIFHEQYSISLASLGSLVLINFTTQMVVDIIAVKFVDKIGYRRAAIPAHIFIVVGLLCLGLLPNMMSNSYLGLIIAVVLLAFGGGLIEVVISPVVDAMPSEDNSASMSLLHSFYCWGQLGVVLITTIILKIYGSSAWTAIAICWAIIPLLNIVNFMRVPLPKTIVEERIPIRKLIQNRSFIIALLLMMCAGAAEQTMAQWASLFAQKGLQLSKVVGDLLGPCLFALLMGMGRTWYGMKGEKLDLKKTLIGFGFMCVACYSVSVFSLYAFVSLLACALTGLSVSLMWPGMISYTSSCFPRGGAAMFGVLAIFGDIGCSIGPWLAGLISNGVQNIPAIVQFSSKFGFNAEQTGLKAGILVGVLFPIIMIIGLNRIHKSEN